MDDHTLLETIQMAIKLSKLEQHPVGSIYTSTKPTDPHELFGGTWEPIQDTFLWCAGPKHEAGTTGGEEAHTLVINEMPEHWHDSLRYKDPHGEQFGCNQGNMTNYPWNIQWSGTGAKDILYTGPSGGSQPHNNMPPYKSVYAWQRVK